MKKILLAAASIAMFVQTNGQTITKDDLKWTVGNKWNTIAYDVDTNTITRTGTGVSWDFTGLTGGSADSLQAEASALNDILFTSSNISSVEYKSITDNWSLAKISTYNADDGTTMHIGLPHTYGKTWTSAGTAAGGFFSFNMAGSVPASGTVTTPYGTFNCLLVREKITSALFNQTNLYWETVEHGRVAVYEGGKLSVMQSTNFTTSTNEAKANGFELFPNPATDVVNVSVKENASLTIFDALGNTVKSAVVNAGLNTVNVADLSAGIYLVQVSSNGSVETSSLVIK